MVPPSAIEPTPEVASGVDAGYLRGIAKVGERLVILLDLDACSGGADAAPLAGTADPGAPALAASTSG
jgi:chemotaxis signal transduction protein